MNTIGLEGLDRQGWGYDIVEAAFKGTSLANGFTCHRRDGFPQTSYPKGSDLS